MTVLVTGTVVDVTGRKDSREWRAWSPVYREGTSGEVVTYREQDVQVVAGNLTARLEPGPCFVQNPDGDRWLVTVPGHDTELWPLIAAAVAIPPGTPADELNAAVAAYFDSHPVEVGPPGPANVLEIGTVTSGPTAGATITGDSPSQTLNLTLPKGDKGDTGNPGEMSTSVYDPTHVNGDAFAMDNMADGTTKRVFTNAEKTKLAGIAAGADVTGAANVAAAGAQMISGRNANNGYAGLDSSGLVPAALLPSYVDDVIEAPNFAALAGGVAGKIYVTLDTNKTYRWSGSAFVEISASPGSTDAVPEGPTNLYYTQARADARVAAGITGKADKTTTVSAGTGLSGGGDLSTNRTLSVAYGAAAGTSCQGNDSRLSDARTPTSHSHVIGDVTGLSAALAPSVTSVTAIAAPSVAATPSAVLNDTSLTAGVTGVTVTGSPADGYRLLLRFKDNGTSRTITLGASFRAMGVTIPTATVAGKWLIIGAIYNGVDSIWDVVATGVQA